MSAPGGALPGSPGPPAEGTPGEAGQRLRSPEQVTLHLPLAGPSSRIFAYALDLIGIFLLELLLLAGLAALLVALTGPPGDWLQELLAPLRDPAASQGPEPGAARTAALVFIAILLLVQFVVELGYFVFWELVTGGRSPGKWILGLRVVADGGRPLGLRESLVRNLLRIADLLPTSYLAGVVSMVMTRDVKRLGDLAAGTVVIRLDRPPPAPPIDLGGDEETAAFRFDREQLARLGRPERTLLRETLRRAERLEGAEAEALLERAAEALRARLGHAEVPARERLAFLRALERALRAR